MQADGILRELVIITPDKTSVQNYRFKLKTLFFHLIT